ncbi:helix-turn-helix transcriptional regulator [Diaphorobacter aerolatus]|uniref:helix-turn-helix transcriptional regulator n=1 Tax=Diaphorobacter aerolatus TaxID=1288495 RepID=UPI00299F54D9|nr:helix-turn-helix transcriptional regulator [Diaphorobacter aerolatus]
MIDTEISPLLERQLLLQLGDRLRRLRKSRGLGTVEMAERAGMSRNTLRAIETGDPAPTIGSYLRVMSVLGVSGDLALLAGDTLQFAPAGSAGARSARPAPVVQVRVSADTTRHQLQDMQSLALHDEAVRMVKARPDLLEQAQQTVERWLLKADSRSAPLWREWTEILKTRSWRKVLGKSRHASSCAKHLRWSRSCRKNLASASWLRSAPSSMASSSVMHWKRRSKNHLPRRTYDP